MLDIFFFLILTCSREKDNQVFGERLQNLDHQSSNKESSKRNLTNFVAQPKLKLSYLKCRLVKKNFVVYTRHSQFSEQE